ncbi:MAG: proline--tRNA ligase [Candidatus Aadella gelida]|nr:proline--tRNA ligase [Candidatus Aadella gelida]
MRWSKAFIPTLKENPQEAEAVSHKLMMRAGLIRRLTAGAYAYLPMGHKALKKAENIIREEMEKAGAVELLMPALQPPELWKRTGRYDDMGDVMIKFIDRHGKEIALGPTHEEIITSLVASEMRSYKDLPLVLYQIQTKFRDELRPRFGIVRSCEFIMKDAYSFDVDAENMEKNYKAMYDAYCRIFERCGLPYIPVEADPGLMGGSVSHEFMVPAEIGEDRIVTCSSCGYASSTEVAEVRCDDEASVGAVPGEKMETADTPKLKSVQEVSKFLKVSKTDIIKTLVYLADNEPIAVLIRGDHEANETKIKHYLKCKTLLLADEETVEKCTGGPMGFSGPVGLTIKKLADKSLLNAGPVVVGANKRDTHMVNAHIGRDFEVDKWLDARDITEGDTCPKCGKEIEVKQAIEIGHTFKLGTKYSEPLQAKYLNAEGKERLAVMGCYGIGINRILACLIETSSDEDGIIWPLSISPCEAVVIPVKKDNEELSREAERVYSEMINAGIDVIIDDRDKSAGVKFKDSDLVGFPFQIVIGKKSMEQGKIELKDRARGESVLVSKNEFIEYIKGEIESRKK